MYPYEKNGAWELYNVEEDRTELNDLAQKFPSRLRYMVHAYETWANRVGVVDWSNLDGKKE